MQSISVREEKVAREKVDLTLNCLMSMDIILTELVEVTLSADINNTDSAFNVTAYKNNEVFIGSQKVDVSALREKYAYLETIKPLRYS